MGFASFYFEKFKALPALIEEKPDNKLEIIVTIPCFKEDNITKALEGLCYCIKPKASVEIIVLVNYPKTSNDIYSSSHKTSYVELQNWASKHHQPGFKFHILISELPEKHAGVGLARKIAMDEALRRLDMIGRPSGLIVGLDADCTLSKNYFIEIEKFFTENPKTPGASIYFEHPIAGNEFSQENYRAITLYELYMRYYTEALRYANYPHAFFTVGSAFVVRADIYAQQGGMNRRKAGEDFYFLHKIIPLGNYGEINGTTIFPSPRGSDRVPFGTGKEVNKIISGSDYEYLTFHPDAFCLIKEFVNSIDKFYNSDTITIRNIISFLPSVMVSLLETENIYNIINICNLNSCNLNNFRKRFYSWFDGLRVLQFLNNLHTMSYNKIPIADASEALLKLKGQQVSEKNPTSLLAQYRKLQK
jgi:hypothetical protein